jgi:hypothetical protein
MVVPCFGQVHVAVKLPRGTVFLLVAKGFHPWLKSGGPLARARVDVFWNDTLKTQTDNGYRIPDNGAA